MSRPRRLAAATALVAAVLAAGACSSDEYVAPPPQQGSEVAHPATAADTVSALQDAVAEGDADAAARLGADGPSRALLAAVAENARALHLEDVTFRYVDETGRADDGGWQGLVDVTWRLKGFDKASARVEVPFSFVDGGDHVAAVGGEGADRMPVWLSGPVAVRRTASTVVFGPRGPADIGRYARWARRAVGQVRSVLGGHPRLAVEVPVDSGALHRALGAKNGEYAAIAAVTAPVDGSRAPGSPVHIFVNPGVFDDLDPVASQVVMTHEAVHAATGAALSSQGELWLVEGFADFVALHDVDLPLSRTAGQVIRQVRKDGLPRQLPSQAEFDTSSTHLGAVYEAAWLVNVTLADRGGVDQLVAFYDAVLAGNDLDGELEEHFGWSRKDLTGAWRARLAAAAGVPE